jgi:hypothetical protein
VIEMNRQNMIVIASVIGFTLVLAFLAFSAAGIFSMADTNQTKQYLPEVREPANQILGCLSHSVILEKQLPDKREKIMVYKVVPLQPTRQNVLLFGQKFNFSTDAQIKEGEVGFGIMAPDHSMHLYLMKSGWVEYTNSDRAHTVNPLDVPGNLPSDEEAVKKATAFLKSQDLLPEGAEFIATDHGKIYRSNEKGEKTVVWEDIAVWYGRKLGGYRVEGTQLMLAIGANGDPIEFFTNWRNYQPDKEMPVKPPEQAFHELKTNGVSVGMSVPDKVSINKVYLAYKTRPGAVTEEYLEPVWVFKGNVLVDGKPVAPVKEFIPALLETPGESVTPVPSTSDSRTSQPLLTVSARNITPPLQTGSPLTTSPPLPDTPAIPVTAAPIDAISR